MDLNKIKAKHNLRFCLELMITSLFGSVIFFILESVFSSFASIVFKILAIVLLGISFLAFATLVVLIAELCLRKHTIAVSKKKEKMANIVQTTINNYNSDSIPLMNSISSQQEKVSSNSYQNSSISETSFQKSLSTSLVFTQNAASSKSLQQHNRLLKLFKNAAVSTLLMNKKSAIEVQGTKVQSSSDPESLPLAVIDWVKPSQMVDLKVHKIKPSSVELERDYIKRDSFQFLTNIPFFTKERKSRKVSRSKSCTYPNIKATTTAYSHHSDQLYVNKLVSRSEFSSGGSPYSTQRLVSGSVSRSGNYPHAHSSKVIARSESCPYSSKIANDSIMQRAESFPSSPISSPNFMISRLEACPHHS